MVWRWTADATYSLSSAYRILFTEQYSIPGAKELSKTRAPRKAKFFTWLALLGRCWTSDRLQRHNMHNNEACALCSQSPETLKHLMFGCVYSREIWFKLLRTSGHQALMPVGDLKLVDWWLPMRKCIIKQRR